MKLTGKMQSITRDWKSGKYSVTFEVEETPAEEVETLMKCEKLSIEVGKFRKKRSLDCNAYCWLIMTKIAEVVRSSKDEIYEEMLQKYGYIYEDEDGYITVTVRADVDMSKIQGHWKFYKSNGKFSSYLMIKGSSEYDTLQMSRFVDAIVEEAKELGIQTETPDQIERMKALWQSQKAS